jgi:hypothetical protein
MASEPQSERVAVRLTLTEFEMLTELVAFTGLNMTDTVRQLIRKEHAREIVSRIGGPPGHTRTATTKTKKKR